MAQYIEIGRSKLSFPLLSHRLVHIRRGTTRLEKGFICFMAMMLMIPAGLLGQMQRPEPAGLPDSIPVGVADPFAVVEDSITVADGTIDIVPVDTVPVVTVPKGQEYDRWEERSVVFNPDPTRAVWLSALCPGLGQVYNRRYWKLPIERCIHIRIHHSHEVYTYHRYDTEVSVTPVIVLSRTQHIGQPCLVQVLLLSCRREKVHIAVSRRIIVHDVAVSAGIVGEHPVVPRRAV